MDYPTTIEKTEEAILQWRNSGIENNLGIQLLTKHLNFLMSYCDRRKKLSDHYNNAKNSYWRRQWGEAISQIEGMLRDYLKIMNEINKDVIIFISGLGGC